MILLYISHLSTNIAAGLNWSVPASVNAQSKIDDVLWINMTNKLMPHWLDVKVHHNIQEFGSKLDNLEILPKPFNHPDLVVFEGFYYMDDVRLARKLYKDHIPYVIIPRGSLTKLALHNHAWLKKWFAHLLYFDRFVKHAAAIQYLTKQEAADSFGRFHTPYFIIPNGFNTPQITKQSFSEDGVKAVFIGRLDMFHKGLDLLIEALSQLHTELRDSHFFLNIFGPRRYDFSKIENEILARDLSDIAAIHNEVSGKDKEQVLLDTDLFIMTSRFEGHPMGLIEALAYGLPCMVTPGTNMLDEIRDSDAGWTCDGTVADISRALLQIVREKNLCAQKGNNGRELSKAYNWDVLAAEFHKCIATYL